MCLTPTFRNPASGLRSFSLPSKLYQRGHPLWGAAIHPTQSTGLVDLNQMTPSSGLEPSNNTNGHQAAAHLQQHGPRARFCPTHAACMISFRSRDLHVPVKGTGSLRGQGTCLGLFQAPFPDGGAGGRQNCPLLPLPWNGQAERFSSRHPHLV